jgi:hypothetical protein
MLWDGKERTEPEYRVLFDEARLTLRRTVPIGEGFSILEGVPKLTLIHGI